MKDGQVVLSVKECAAYLGISGTAFVEHESSLAALRPATTISLGKKATVWRFNKEDVNRWRMEQSAIWEECSST